MWWFGLHDKTVLVRIVVTGDPGPDGVPVRSTSDREIEGVNVQQVATSESPGPQTDTVSRYRVSCSSVETWVSEKDEVRLPGDPRVFAVEGDPHHLTATGDLDHTEFVVVSTGRRW